MFIVIDYNSDNIINIILITVKYKSKILLSNHQHINNFLSVFSDK